MSIPRFLLSGVFISVAGARLVAADVPSVTVVRVQQLVQTSSNAPVLDPDSPYFFRAQAVKLPKQQIEHISLLFPNTGVFLDEPKSYDGRTEEASLEGYYKDKAAFDATFPSGTYRVDLVPFSGTSTKLSLKIAKVAFPTTPRIENYTASQSVAAGSSFAVKWNAFASPTTRDRIVFTVTSADGEYDYVATAEPETAEAMAATARSFTIPAKSLPPGVDLIGQLIFVREDVRGKTSAGYPYASGAASSTRFKIHTAGSADTKVPTVSSSSPANAATGVSSTATVTITFNEPMRTKQGWSISFANLGSKSPAFAWTSSTKFTIKPPSGGWPKNTEVGVILNPAGYTPWFQDLTGNPLAPKTIKFKVGGS